jgi:hypothetical protein
LKLPAKVYATETPAGEAAVAVHRGQYNRMKRGTRRDPKMDGGKTAGSPLATRGRYTEIRRRIRPDTETVVYFLR